MRSGRPVTSFTEEPCVRARRRPLWLPWVDGPHESPSGPVFVSLTEFNASAWLDLPAMTWTALALRSGWYGLPGAVGMHLWADPLRRCVGSLTVWTEESALRRWVGLPRHVEVMRRYRPRGAARTTSWTCPAFDRAAILAEAKACLSGDPASPRQMSRSARHRP